MEYPMKHYYEYFIIPSNTINYTMPYSAVRNLITCVQLSAKPINKDIRSPWLTLDERTSLDSYLGKSPYKGRKGIEPCGAKGVYLINVLDKDGNYLKIANLIERSRLQEAKDLGVKVGYVDKDLVYPMVGGRNIDKWGIKSHLYMLVPHYNSGDGIYRGIPVEDLQSKYFKTYDWLYYFHDLLRDTRIRSAKFFDINQFPWYRLDNVGEYTFMPYKVLWKEQAKSLDCCVVSSISNEYVSKKTVVTDSKVLSVSFNSEYEAHYLCAVLNSNVIEKIIQAYTIDTNRGTDIVSNIKIPKFDSNDERHMELASLSLEAHKNYASGKRNAQIEQRINSIVPLIFNNKADNL
jgi:hypothetical protein